MRARLQQCRSGVIVMSVGSVITLDETKVNLHVNQPASMEGVFRDTNTGRVGICNAYSDVGLYVIDDVKAANKKRSFTLRTRQMVKNE